MSRVEVHDRSDQLVSLIDGLGAALRGAGVSDEATSRLLENASAAVLDALTLDLMFQDGEAAPAAAPTDQPRPEPGLPLAA